jgi:hypothetical protein
MFFDQPADSLKGFPFIQQFLDDHSCSAERAFRDFFFREIDDKCLFTLGALNLYRFGFFSHLRLSLGKVFSGNEPT